VRARTASSALYDAGVLVPLLDRTCPFEQTPDALAYVEQGRANGKIVVSMPDPAADGRVRLAAASTSVVALRPLVFTCHS